MVKKLAVSGAFHTTLMKEAAEPLNAALKGFFFNISTFNPNLTGNFSEKIKVDETMYSLN